MVIVEVILDTKVEVEARTRSTISIRHYFYFAKSVHTFTLYTYLVSNLAELMI